MDTKSPWVIIREAVKPMLTRKGGIGFGTIVYSLGLRVWSFSAWINDITSGVVFPKAPQQWFVAGIIPALTLFACYLSIRVLWGLPVWTRHVPKNRWPEFQKGLERHLVAVNGIGFVCIVILANISSFTDLLDPVRKGLTLGLAGMMFISVLVTERLGFLTKFVYYNYAVIAILTVLALGTIGYAEEIFPGIPQSFGGARPACAIIDVDTAQLSPSTIRTLLNDPSFKKDSKLSSIKSVKVNLVFRNGDTIYVRPAEETAPSGHKPIELTQKIFRTCDNQSTWFGNSDAKAPCFFRVFCSLR